MEERKGAICELQIAITGLSPFKNVTPIGSSRKERGGTPPRKGLRGGDAFEVREKGN